MQVAYEKDSKRASILIADDDPGIRSVLFDLLSEDYDCLAVGSAEEALAELRVAPYDLVVTDITMGGMSGLEMLPEVRARRPDVPVIMITAYGDAEMRQRAIERGAEGLLTKPIDFALLRQEIDTRLGHAI